MSLHHGPLQWPCRCFGAMHTTLPNEHDQGFARSHWTPPLGSYLLCIAPAAARATANKTMMKNAPTLLAILVAVALHQYNTSPITQLRRFMDFLEATARHHQASICSDNINRTHQHRCFVVLFIIKLLKKATR
jgi:hypothetical protein